MNAERGCMWAGEEPPGPYSTSTPFMLLPGTLGSAWSNTTVTLAVGAAVSAAWAVRNDVAETAAAIRNLRMGVSSKSREPCCERRFPEPRLAERVQRCVVDGSAVVRRL